MNHNCHNTFYLLKIQMRYFFFLNRTSLEFFSITTTIFIHSNLQNIIIKHDSLEQPQPINPKHTQQKQNSNTIKTKVVRDVWQSLAHARHPFVQDRTRSGEIGCVRARLPPVAPLAASDRTRQHSLNFKFYISGSRRKRALVPAYIFNTRIPLLCLS